MKSVPSDQQVPNLDWTLLQQIEQAIELPVFYDELKAFATAYGITGNLLMDDMEWISFLRHYAGVIEDSPLICTTANLKCVTKVVVRRIDVPEGTPFDDIGTLILFALQWEWISSDDPNMTNLRQKFFTYRPQP